MDEAKETVIYENAFDKTQEEWSAEMREDWVMEGKGIAECGDVFGAREEGMLAGIEIIARRHIEPNQRLASGHEYQGRHDEDRRKGKGEASKIENR